MAAKKNNPDDVKVEQDIATKLNVDVTSIAKKISNIVLPSILTKIEEVKLKNTANKEPEAKGTNFSSLITEQLSGLIKILGTSFVAPGSVAAQDKLPTVLVAIKKLIGDNKGKQKEDKESTEKSPKDAPKDKEGIQSKKETLPDGLIKDLYKAITTLAKKSDPSSEKKSLLEAEKVKPQNVIVTGFSNQSLETLSGILPEAITKGTAALTDHFSKLLEKFDELLKLVTKIEQKDFGGSGSTGGGLLDTLASAAGGKKAKGRGTRKRNAAAAKLKKQRAAYKAGKGPKPTRVSAPLKSVTPKVPPVAATPPKLPPVSAVKPTGGVVDSIKSAGTKGVGMLKSAGSGALDTISNSKAAGTLKKVGSGALDTVKNIGSSSAAKTATKYAGTAVKGLGVAGAVLGAGMEFSSRKEEGQTNTQAAVGTGGTVAGAGLGGWGGAAAGAAIGSLIFPGVGTVIGGVIGGIAGGMAGGAAGGAIADKATGVGAVPDDKALVENWKAGTIKSDPKLGKELVSTYESLPAPKQEVILNLLKAQASETEAVHKEEVATSIIEKLTEENPKLQYGNKVSPALTETLDKNLPKSQPSPTPPKSESPNKDTIDKVNAQKQTKSTVPQEVSLNKPIQMQLEEPVKRKTGPSLDRLEQNKKRILSGGPIKHVSPETLPLVSSGGAAAMGIESLMLEKPEPSEEGPEPPEQSEDPEYPQSDSTVKPTEASKQSIKPISGGKSKESIMAKAGKTALASAVPFGGMALAAANLLSSKPTDKEEVPESVSKVVTPIGKTEKPDIKKLRAERHFAKKFGLVKVDPKGHTYQNNNGDTYEYKNGKFVDEFGEDASSELNLTSKSSKVKAAGGTSAKLKGGEVVPGTVSGKVGLSEEDIADMNISGSDTSTRESTINGKGSRSTTTRTVGNASSHNKISGEDPTITVSKKAKPATDSIKASVDPTQNWQMPRGGAYSYVKAEVPNNRISPDGAGNKQSGTGDETLKDIANNTNETNNKLGQLIQSFNNLSKSIGSGGSNSSPIVINKSSPRPPNDNLTSGQIAKGGNPAIANLRSSLENTRQIPA